MAKGRDGNEASDNWKTPDYIFTPLNKEFRFNFDPCPLNHDLSLWDGLKIDWPEGAIFCNPPYNKIDKPKWIKKCFDEWRKGKTVVMLLPAATGTSDFHNYIYPYAEIRFVKGRIKFEGINTKGEKAKGGGKLDSMIVIFKH